MRADRLLSLMLLLQNRGRMTAAELARRLEVSERTIYRDIDALSAAGVPVYGEPGREGGFDLLDSYRTSLTGLNEKEVRALFMLSIPSPLGELGIGVDLQAALMKLSAALPGVSRRGEESLRQRIHLDWLGWRSVQEPVPFLRSIEQALWQDRKLHICYQSFFAAQLERTVDPYGLVAKAGVWHLVSRRNEKMQVQRVSELRDVQLGRETFRRDPGFDLMDFWSGWCQRMEGRHSIYSATVLADASAAQGLKKVFWDGIHRKVLLEGAPDASGRVRLVISFESLEEARAVLLGYGGCLEVLEPQALRMSIEDYARQIFQRYDEQGR